MPDEGLTLREAAIRLGVSEGAIRKRVARGTIRSEMRSDGRRYVWLDGADEGDDGGADTSVPGESPTLRFFSAAGAALVEELRERVRSLEEQLRRADERDRENRRIIAALTSRIPELEAPSQEASGPPETATEQPGRVGPQTRLEGAQEGAQRPWWRRVFGGG